MKGKNLGRTIENRGRRQAIVRDVDKVGNFSKSRVDKHHGQDDGAVVSDDANHDLPRDYDRKVILFSQVMNVDEPLSIPNPSKRPRDR